MVRLNPQACGNDWEMIGQKITSAAWQKKRERATINANRTDRPGSSVEDTHLGPYGAMVRCDNQVGFYFEAPGDLALTSFPLKGTDGSVFHRYPGCGPYEHKTAFLQMIYAPDATNTFFLQSFILSGYLQFVARENKHPLEDSILFW
ncbi:hypothetical protein BO82DRAFT_391531 [Aspergillus uvarum CBS 121591]|uniref:Uncharacterized protein n=1 Tax=Aspergillus uvarum CBS 121591 TaxID=1448315 RepID=A0A319CHK3_9EURO|nr:hypothetical protein BO82DRAFT_391531 [Aspergillus uvarum CBS 121591]PYH82737.1 hypothetical protein BO82DRAFT_391531 [Aspergillus uvarum CBS 121591]